MSEDTTTPAISPIVPETPAPPVDSIPAPTTAATPPAAPTIPGVTKAAPPIPRPRQAIQVEYTNAAAQLGNLVFGLAVREQQRAQLMQQMNSLAQEAADLPPEAPASKPPVSDGTA